MFRLVAIGLWVVLVTSGATFASAYLVGHSSGGADPKKDTGLEDMSTDMMSVPVIRGGEVVGYLIMQLSFAVDRSSLEDRKVELLPFMQDAAFRTIFSDQDVDFRRLRPGDLDRLTGAIAKEANGRLGADLVRHVLLQQVNYVRKEDIRTNWISGSGNGK